MTDVQLDENGKVEPFFQKLGRLAADVENGVKEAQKKISLPKSDLPENSALIASVQLHDCLAELKKEIDATGEEIDETEFDRKNFMDSFHGAVKDAERKLDELENVLKKYGYVPWEPPQEVIEETTGNSENTRDAGDAIPETTGKIITMQIDGEKPSDDRPFTPVCSSRALTNTLCSSTNVRNSAYRYNIDDVTPQLNLRKSRTQSGGHLRTPVCFSDDVICTPGLFIPFQKKCLKNGTLMSPNLFRSTYFPSHQCMNEIENVYRNVNSPQFYEDITIELFKTSHALNDKKQKESVNPEEPVTCHIIEEIQKYRRERKTAKREQSITPEELTLAQELINKIQKNSRLNFKEDSITPEEPVLRVQQRLEDIGKSAKKNTGFQNKTAVRDENSTPESPKLKTYSFLKKSKIYQKYQQKS